MRKLLAEARLHRHARFLSGRPGTEIHMVALYGAFTVIAAVIVRSLFIHPF